MVHVAPDTGASPANRRPSPRARRHLKNAKNWCTWLAGIQENKQGKDDAFEKAHGLVGWLVPCLLVASSFLASLLVAFVVSQEEGARCAVVDCECGCPEQVQKVMMDASEHTAVSSPTPAAPQGMRSPPTGGPTPAPSSSPNPNPSARTSSQEISSFKVSNSKSVRLPPLIEGFLPKLGCDVINTHVPNSSLNDHGRHHGGLSRLHQPASLFQKYYDHDHLSNKHGSVDSNC